MPNRTSRTLNERLPGAGKALMCTAGLALLVAAGCQGKATQEALMELREGQKQILERLDRMEKGQQQILSSPMFARQRPQIDYSKIYDIETGGSPVRGAADGKVTLVEFSDFQCPYSQRAQAVIQQLLEAFPNDLKHVYKNFPLSFHKRAMPAAQACLAAGLQGKFWEMHDLVFSNPQNLEDQDFKAHAQKLGLDIARFEADLQSETVMKRIEADTEDAKKAEVMGTPTLFLNGKRVADRSFEAMKQEIEALLGTAAKGS